MYKNGWDTITQDAEYRPAAYIEVEDAPIPTTTSSSTTTSA